MDLKKIWEENRSKLKELFLYGVFGVLTTILNIALYRILSGIMNHLIANAIAWVICVLFAFLTNKVFVFESKSFETKLVLKELAAFTAARLATGVFDELFMFTAVDLLKCGQMNLEAFGLTINGATIAKIISNIIVIIFNYIFSKLFIFAKKDKIKQA
ncbi:MAG: GtrA family protein [Spirochaetaceae bacterium]|nr:GtrA family protein [Spirochaetaceae bacterium]